MLMKGKFREKLVRLGRRPFAVHLEEIGNKAHELDGREFLIKHRDIRHIAEHGLGLKRRSCHVMPADGHATSQRLHETGEQFDGRGLSGSIGTEKGKQLARRNLHCEAIKGLQATVVHGEVFDFNH